MKWEQIYKFMQQRIYQEKQNQQTLDIFSYTEETIHLFNQIMSEEYSKNLNSDKLEDDLAKFFNGLIWAEKRNPLLVYQMFQLKSCHKIVEKYIHVNPIVILRNSILLLGNCEGGGLVAEQLVEHQYPHCLLTHILNPGLLTKYHEEVAEYIGIFMKCYYKLFRIEWLSKFILEDDYFELLEINLKYYNCPDFMARTNALNIVLDLLRQTAVRHFISGCTARRVFYCTIFERMCKLFRNQLAEFGLRISHISKEDNVDYIFSELEDKIALWLDIANNFSGIEHIIESTFCDNVLLPLVIGPISAIDMPLFTLKYSLFVINKLLPIMKRFCVLDIYIRAIFIQDHIFYYPNSLRKAFIEPFSLQKLLSKQITLDETEEKERHEKIKDFYKNLFHSKDNHFILMVNSLFCKLFNQVQTCPHICKVYGFNYNGQMSVKVCRILLHQLKDIYQLHTIQSVLDTLVSINNGKSLQTELQNQYIYIFQHLMSQLKNGLHLSKSANANQNIKNLAETVEYDLNITNKIRFAKDKDLSKYETIFKVVFEWEIRKEELMSKEFYGRIPDSPAEYLRYLFIKFLYLKKARVVFLDNIPNTNEYEHYHELMLTHCPYIPEDLYNPSQIPEFLHICELLSQNEKSPLPAYFIKDNNFFILGIPKNQRILITQGVNLKHIAVEDGRKKKVKVTIKNFSFEFMEMTSAETLWMRIDSSLVDHIIKRNEAIIGKNIEFVRQFLQKTESEQPVPSLI